MADYHSMNIALTGDSIIARKISVHKDLATRQLYDLIKKADVSFTNLEVLPNDFQGYPAARSDGAHFAAHSNVLDDLQKIGFNLFSCANNHSLDYGIEGLLATMEQLEKRDISYAGIGKNLTEARMPVYYETSGGTVAMLAATSTFFIEDQAGEARPEMRGRPGSNPLAFDVEYQLTAEQIENLREIDRALGFAKHRQEFIHLGFRTAVEDETIFPFEDTNLRVANTLAANFHLADEAKVHTKPNERDLQEIIKWIKEARSRSDVVMMSLHAHEQSISREHPAEYIETFARAVIDAGADIVVIHGPHLLRGMEIYEGKLIFYSLGNFIGHNELVYKLPEDSYKRFGVASSETPGVIFDKRSDGGKKGFPSNHLYWQSVVPVCQFDAGQLQSVKLYPIVLTNGKQPHYRGRPFLASGETGRKIMDKFSELSREYGTKITCNNDGVAVVKDFPNN
ncbi:MAG TPA: CapA family protein [Bacillota bacterium]|nr:CapA family protein [Bacillota bacterium]